MAIAIVLVVMVVGSIIFHFWSPWWFTPLASNWGSMDDLIIITFWVTGIVFVLVNFFIAYCVFKFRHTEGRRAAYEPENNSLEKWLTGLTTVGVLVMLAPGLVVYNDFVEVPPEAVIFEAVGQQWQWSFRYPGADGVLGDADNRNVTFKNPVGIDPDDGYGDDDIVITGQAAHLLLDQPVKVNLRSKDVLHDFYIPNMRVKMDLVPGLVTYLWFTPTRTGTYELMCAELCGVGHYNMRSHIVVDTQADYDAWMAQQPTFAESTGKVPPRVKQVALDPVAAGLKVAQRNGCIACHTLDGGRGVGPSWKGMWGRRETMADGSEITVDAAYLTESIRNPAAKVVQGYPPIMTAYPLEDEDIAALIALAKSLQEDQ